MYKVILFYKFTNIENPEKFRDEQKEICEDLGLKGRMLIAEEGINGTFEGTIENIERYKKELKKIKIEGLKIFEDIKFKESEGTGKAFTKLQITVKPEVVTLGAGKFDVAKETAKEITADQFEELYEKGEDFVVLDLRNDYEIKAGYFDKTINPELENFRDLPNKIEKLKVWKDSKVVAVCTGGIRCEKATCLLKQHGFTNLYQLKDGIHTYMEQYPNKHFKGTLFVFDNRMTTPVVDLENREVVGQCIYCGVKCEEFASDDSLRPSRKIICCPSCFDSHSDNLRRCTPLENSTVL